jgi:hypothetical protein
MNDSTTLHRSAARRNQNRAGERLAQSFLFHAKLLTALEAQVCKPLIINATIFASWEGADAQRKTKKRSRAWFSLRLCASARKNPRETARF